MTLKYYMTFFFFNTSLTIFLR